MPGNTKPTTKTMKKNQANWILSKAVKLDTFNRMCEKAWADSGLQDESIKKAVYDELAKWYKLDRKSPWAGFGEWDKSRIHSQGELEKNMYGEFDFQFYGYKADN